MCRRVHIQHSRSLNKPNFNVCKITPGIVREWERGFIGSTADCHSIFIWNEMPLVNFNIERPIDQFQWRYNIAYRRYYLTHLFRKNSAHSINLYTCSHFGSIHGEWSRRKESTITRLQQGRPQRICINIGVFCYFMKWKKINTSIHICSQQIHKQKRAGIHRHWVS